jgi:trehalose 6-phosphate phosphatase
MTVDPQAMIFDLDGVITFTARLHAAAWKELFDQYLTARASRVHEHFREFTQDDYLAYVDGKPRYDGVASFLRARGISLRYGQQSDPPTAETVRGLGNRKDNLFLEKLHTVGVEVDNYAVKLVRDMRERGVRIGLASSSRNAVPVLNKAGIRNLFDSIVDGIVSDRLHLRGKPAPDIFLQCLDQLTAHTDPQRAGIAEDAIAGVRAGRRGGFALVLGVDRRNTGALAQNGANWVINDFRQITADQVVRFFAERAHVA